MRYLIDGYNLFFKIQENILPLPIKRGNFIKDLDSEIKDLHLNATAVFDSNQKNAHTSPSSKKLEALEVVFSPKHLSADAYILELLTWNSKNTTLVTSDRELGIQASYLGVKTQTIEDFIDFLLKRRLKKTPGEDVKLELRESDANLKRLLDIFEKRLNEDESV